MENPKWTLKRSSDDKFYFTLQAANGEVILTSEMYESRSGAFKGIQAIVKVASSAPVMDQSHKEEEDDTDQD